MFFSLPNLKSTAVELMEKPWDYKSPSSPPTSEAHPKEFFRKWCLELTTDHAFISMFEGLTSSLRINYEAENPPLKMYGLIADYDVDITDDMIQRIKDKPRSEFRPNYLVRSFSGMRLIWIFEAPLLFSNKDQTQAFIVLIRKKLALTKWLPGLDTGALNATTYFEIGKEWIPIQPEARIPKAHLNLWQIQISRDLNLLSKGEIEYEIPLDKVALEIEERFPGRWTGPFELQARGVRFWDPDSRDSTAAVVFKQGMYCFTGEQAFMSWGKIFGKAFIEKFEADKIGTVLDQMAWDGQRFWIYGHGRWRDYDKEDTKLQLKVRGFNPKRGGGNFCSEVERIIEAVLTQRRVTRAFPFPHFPSGLMQNPIDKETYLNTSTLSAVVPAAPPVTGKKMQFIDGRKFFPLIYKLLKTFFPEGDGQLEFFLAWIKYFYLGCLSKQPQPGQVVIIAGPVAKGKTLLSRHIIAGLVGGYSDASDHLVGGDPWTETLVQYPVMAIDDCLSGIDSRHARLYANKLKSYVANAVVKYNQKYKQTGYVPFYGRIIITTNLDYESLSILPDIDISSKDKISLFRTSDHVIKFPSRINIQKSLSQELPFLARFLVDWEYPPHIYDEQWRFGVKEYHHPELLKYTKQQGATGLLLEILVPFLEIYGKDRKGEDLYENTAAGLFADLKAFNDVIMKDLNAKVLSNCLGSLAKDGHPITMKHVAKGIRKWVMPYNFEPKEELEKPEEKE